MDVKRFLHGVIRGINKYRQMDSRGMPVDIYLVIQLLLVIAVYAIVAYQMSRKIK